MSNNKDKSKKTSLSMTRVVVSKWALDVVMDIEAKFTDNLDRVLALAIILDNEGVIITAGTVMSAIEWVDLDCADLSDDMGEIERVLGIATEKYFMLRVTDGCRHLLDYAAILMHLREQGYVMFYKPGFVGAA